MKNTVHRTKNAIISYYWSSRFADNEKHGKALNTATINKTQLWRFLFLLWTMFLILLSVPWLFVRILCKTYWCSYRFYTESWQMAGGLTIKLKNTAHRIKINAIIQSYWLPRFEDHDKHGKPLNIGTLRKKNLWHFIYIVDYVFQF